MDLNDALVLCQIESPTQDIFTSPFQRMRLQGLKGIQGIFRGRNDEVGLRLILDIILHLNSLLNVLSSIYDLIKQMLRLHRRRKQVLFLHFSDNWLCIVISNLEGVFYHFQKHLQESEILCSCKMVPRHIRPN